MYEEIKKKICKYENKGDFTYASFNNDKLLSAEGQLGMKIPEQFVWFLKTFGHGGLDGIEIIGVGKNEELLFVNETIRYREYGFPNSWIAIENCDEWIYSINSINGKIGVWSQGQTECKCVFDSFLEYLNDRIDDAIENM